MTIPREGIFYRTRDGHKVGPMVPDNGERYGAEWPWRVPEEGGPPFMDFAPAWRLDGTFHATPGARHPYDLVAEWADEPAASIPELMQDLAVTEASPAKALTDERHSTHGDWLEQASISQELMGVIGCNDGRLADHQKEALQMIAVKISRILSGDPNHADHWDDIAGYAYLGKAGHAPLTPDKPQA